MKHLVALFLVLISVGLPSVASANLLDQVRLEDVLRERAMGVILLLDADAKVFVKVKFDALSGDLPGGLSSDSAVPQNPDVDDIQKVEVTIYTKKDPVPEEIKKAVIAALSVPERKVVVDFKQWEFLKGQNFASTEITVQNLNEVISGSAGAFLNRFGYYIAGSVFAFLILGFVLGWMRSRDVKGQTQELVSAVKSFSESGGGRVSSASAPVAEAAVQQSQQQSFSGPSGKGQGHDDYLSTLGLESLKELFGDCYWTNADAYAHHLWRALPVKTRESLISELDYMKEYVNYFFSQRPQDLGVHEHPYYLNPQPLSKTSQADVLAQVSKKVALWTALSPLRQSRLELGMMDRVKALQTADGAKSLSIEGKKSPLRELPVVAEIGDLKAEDEIAIFENPDSIPAVLRSKVKSLVWLALHETPYITEVLNSIDAKSLAAGWIGPKPVLEKLESCLPEKKRTMVNEYRLKSRPSRRSAVFAQLHRAGLQQPETTQANNDESTKAA